MIPHRKWRVVKNELAPESGWMDVTISRHFTELGAAKKAWKFARKHKRRTWVTTP